MIHSINSIGVLYNDTITAKNKIVDGTAVDILSCLGKSIEILKNNWHGIDAGKQIQKLVFAYNKMVEVRNHLDLICAGLTKILKGYEKMIITFDSKKEESYIRLRYEPLKILEDYYDSSDLIDINASVLESIKFINKAKSALDIFVTETNNFHNAVLSNWLEGPGRDQFEYRFNLFLKSLEKFKENFMNSSSDINTAFENYSDLH